MSRNNNDLAMEIASCFGIKRNIEQLKKKLLEVPYVKDVEFDLQGYLDDIYQVIFITKYDIPMHSDGYTQRRQACKYGALQAAYECGLKPSGDAIENHGGYFYYVLNSKDWKVQFAG
ncbi:MAG: hypothetical protein J5525_13400 [Lachnospiraceae bacterium]|nr:hypothetical protein [Lachnospiraceae bacterium]